MMRGIILANGILRAEDGKRYHFKLDEIQNLSKFSSTNEYSLDGLEVDFEKGEKDEAISLFILESKKIDSHNMQAKIKEPIKSFCEEVEMDIKSKFNIFRGIIEESSEFTTTHTFGKINDNIQRVTDLIQKRNQFKMGDKTFIFDFYVFNEPSPFFPLTEPTNPNNIHNEINLESGDEVILAALKDKTGFYRVEALKNLSKDYHLSHIKNVPLYFRLLTITSIVLIAAFLISLLAIFYGDYSGLTACVFVLLPCFLLGRFFTLRFLGIKKRQKIDRFIKDYVKP